MFFSVVIPCYNSELYIENAINSLTSQTFKDFEAIFIDDCSTDSTYEKLLSLTKNICFEVQIYKNEKNSGPGISKRIGVTNAKGRYILFMDSDDWFQYDAFQLLYDKLLIEPSDIVFFDGYRTYETGDRVLIANSHNMRACNELSDFVAVANGALPFMCFRTELWKNIIIPPLYNAEDIAVIPVLISKSKKVSILSKPLYNYFYRVNSVSNIINPRIYRSFLESFAYTSLMITEQSYFQALEFHGIKTVLYGAVINGLKAGLTKSEFQIIIDEFSCKFPFWRKNRYVNVLPNHKKVFLQLVHWRLFYFLKIFVTLHKFSLNVLRK